MSLNKIFLNENVIKSKIRAGKKLEDIFKEGDIAFMDEWAEKYYDSSDEEREEMIKGGS